MLDGSKLKELIKERKMSVEQLAGQLVRGGLKKEAGASALKNWQNGLYKPLPQKEDISQLATALDVEGDGYCRGGSHHICMHRWPRERYGW